MAINKNTTTLILAGGLGTRISSLFPHIPKPLIQFGEKTFLELQIENFRKYGLNKFALLIGPNSSPFEKIFKNSKDVSLISENERTGTGGAIANAVKVLGLQNPFLVANGDTWWHGNLDEFLNTDYPIERLPCALATRSKTEKRYGSLKPIHSSYLYQFADGDGDECSHSFAGLAWLKPELIKHQGFFSLENEIINTTFIHNWDGNFFDFGTPDGYEELKRVLV